MVIQPNKFISAVIEEYGIGEDRVIAVPDPEYRYQLCPQGLQIILQTSAGEQWKNRYFITSEAGWRRHCSVEPPENACRRYESPSSLFHDSMCLNESKGAEI